MRVPLRWVFSKGYISSDPTLSFKYINYKPKEKGALSLLEMGKIEALDWPDIRQKAALILGFSCGLRRGEIRALRWKYVDLNRHIITVIGNIEISKRFPSAQYLNRIVKVLGVKPADLFAEESDSEAVSPVQIIKNIRLNWKGI